MVNKTSQLPKRRAPMISRSCAALIRGTNLLSKEISRAYASGTPFNLSLEFSRCSNDNHTQLNSIALADWVPLDTYWIIASRPTPYFDTNTANPWTDNRQPKSSPSHSLNISFFVVGERFCRQLWPRQMKSKRNRGMVPWCGPTTTRLAMSLAHNRHNMF